MQKKRSKLTQTSPRLEAAALSDLVPHPDQSKYFRTYGAFEYEALKNDIAANGVTNPIAVLPPGNAAGLPSRTIIFGHTRRKILLELGHASANVLVRYDLINATRAEVDELFLLDNTARRQLDRLGQARAAVGLFLIEKEKKGRRVIGDPLQQGELRDRIGAIIRMSGRNLARYLNVLNAPSEVQDAFEARVISLQTASRVVTLPQLQRERLAKRLQAGEEPKSVFKDFFPDKSGIHVQPNDALASFVRSLESAQADLGHRINEVRSNPVRVHEAALRRGRKLIRALLAKLEPPSPET